MRSSRRGGLLCGSSHFLRCPNEQVADGPTSRPPPPPPPPGAFRRGLWLPQPLPAAFGLLRSERKWQDVRECFATCTRCWTARQKGFSRLGESLVRARSSSDERPERVWRWGGLGGGAARAGGRRCRVRRMLVRTALRAERGAKCRSRASPLSIDHQPLVIGRKSCVHLALDRAGGRAYSAAEEFYVVIIRAPSQQVRVVLCICAGAPSRTE